MLSTCACTDTSSAEVGSSQTRNSGCVASARAIEMRWRWPPENWCGNFSHVGRGQPDRLQQLGHRVAQRRRVARPGRARAAARRRCRAPSSAGSGWRTGPGRSSACAGAAASACRPRACACRRRRSAPCRASARTGPPAGAPPCSCRSPIRRPAPASCRARWLKLTPSTACTNCRGLRSTTRFSQGAETSKVFARSTPRHATSAAHATSPPRLVDAASRRRAWRRRPAGRAARRGSGRTPAGSAG